MQCPYCQKEMTPGYLRCDRRSKPVWFAEDDRVPALDRTLGGIGQLTVAEVGLCQIRIPSNYCSDCKKMIIDTELTT